MSSDTDINLDSFLDIMTCLVGVLILIILLTGVDASQVKVLIPTPMERGIDKRPIFIECRDDQLYHLDLNDLRALAKDELRKIGQGSGDDMGATLRLMAEADVTDGTYNVDLTFALAGYLAFKPVEGVAGYEMTDYVGESETDWLGQILTSMNPEEEQISFLVRDDSYRVFKVARYLAWVQEIDVSYELLSTDDVIKFGLGGVAPQPQ